MDIKLTMGCSALRTSSRAQTLMFVRTPSVLSLRSDLVGCESEEWTRHRGRHIVCGNGDVTSAQGGNFWCAQTAGFVQGGVLTCCRMTCIALIDYDVARIRPTWRTLSALLQPQILLDDDTESPSRGLVLVPLA